MKRLAIVFFAVIVLLSGCAQPPDSSAAFYKQITQEEAKEMMTKNDGHIIVDVRRQDEYDEGHIPDAVLIPNESITDSVLFRSLRQMCFQAEKQKSTPLILYQRCVFIGTSDMGSSILLLSVKAVSFSVLLSEIVPPGQFLNKSLSSQINL